MLHYNLSRTVLFSRFQNNLNTRWEKYGYIPFEALSIHYLYTQLMASQIKKCSTPKIDK